jgi:Allene oxide cyclase
MRSIFHVATARGLGAATFLGAAALMLAGMPAGAAEMEQLNLVERATSDSVVDLGDKGDSAGDLLTFANDIYDAADANKVGTDNGYCIRVVAGKSWECFWTLTLADGQITVEGPFLDGGDSVLAVTGGTGKYAGVRGEMALHARNAEGTAYDFKYSLMH